MGETLRVPSIDISKQGFRIDGVLMEPLTMSGLTDAFGEPRLWFDETRAVGEGRAEPSWAIWDDLGLRTVPKADDSAHGLYVTVSVDPQRQSVGGGDANRPFPTGTYSGDYTVNGKAPLAAVPIRELRKAYLLVNWNLGDWRLVFRLNDTELADLHAMEFKERFVKMQTDDLADMVRAAREPFYEFMAYYSPKPAVKEPSGKWNLPIATEPTIELKSIPFRLAIIQELMYDKRLLEPRFDVYHFSQDQGARNFDPDSYYVRMIPAVRKWFLNYPIPVRLAERVEELLLDGGNDVYRQLIPQWDGEDDRFLIKSLSEGDLAWFPNLKFVRDIADFLGPRARKSLEQRGVTIV